MKIGVLTSSRADYGIYQPLLNKLSIDARFDLEIIAFGMHLKNIKEIRSKIFEKMAIRRFIKLE